jgi:hypothetical protein
VVNALLWRQPPYKWFLMAQGLFYGLAALGRFVNLRPKVLLLPYYFCMINSALFAWMYYALRLRRAIPSRVQLDKIGNRPAGG